MHSIHAAAPPSGPTGRSVDRRQVMGFAAALPLLTLPGCATTGQLSLTEAITRLLTLASQRAFAILLQPGGFYDSQISRIALPPQFSGGGNLLAQLLGSAPVRERLARELNRAAESGARRAAPIIADSIGALQVTDALAIVRGGPEAATRLLEGQLAEGLIPAMFPAVGDALRLADEPVIAQALRAVSGFDIAGLARHVADQANRGIWNGIAAQEAAIRADPQATNDPLLIGVFGLLR